MPYISALLLQLNGWLCSICIYAENMDSNIWRFSGSESSTLETNV